MSIISPSQRASLTTTSQDLTPWSQSVSPVQTTASGGNASPASLMIPVKIPFSYDQVPFSVDIKLILSSIKQGSANGIWSLKLNRNTNDVDSEKYSLVVPAGTSPTDAFVSINTSLDAGTGPWTDQLFIYVTPPSTAPDASTWRIGAQSSTVIFSSFNPGVNVGDTCMYFNPENTPSITITSGITPTNGKVYELGSLPIIDGKYTSTAVGGSPYKAGSTPRVYSTGGSGYSTTINKFTTNNTIVIPSGPAAFGLTYDIFLVGAGQGGFPAQKVTNGVNGMIGQIMGFGGGGAGGPVNWKKLYPLAPGTYTITVGNGSTTLAGPETLTSSGTGCTQAAGSSVSYPVHSFGAVYNDINVSTAGNGTQYYDGIYYGAGGGSGSGVYINTNINGLAHVAGASAYNGGRVSYTSYQVSTNGMQNYEYWTSGPNGSPGTISGAGVNGGGYTQSTPYAYYYRNLPNNQRDLIITVGEEALSRSIEENRTTGADLPPDNRRVIENTVWRDIVGYDVNTLAIRSSGAAGTGAGGGGGGLGDLSPYNPMGSGVQQDLALTYNSWRNTDAPQVSAYYVGMYLYDGLLVSYLGATWKCVINPGRTATSGDAPSNYSSSVWSAFVPATGPFLASYTFLDGKTSLANIVDQLALASSSERPSGFSTKGQITNIYYGNSPPVGSGGSGCAIISWLPLQRLSMPYIYGQTTGSYVFCSASYVLPESIPAATWRVNFCYTAIIQGTCSLKVEAAYVTPTGVYVPIASGTASLTTTSVTNFGYNADGTPKWVQEGGFAQPAISVPATTIPPGCKLAISFTPTFTGPAGSVFRLLFEGDCGIGGTPNGLAGSLLIPQMSALTVFPRGVLYKTVKISAHTTITFPIPGISRNIENTKWPTSGAAAYVEILAPAGNPGLPDLTPVIVDIQNNGPSSAAVAAGAAGYSSYTSSDRYFTLAQNVVINANAAALSYLSNTSSPGGKGALVRGITKGYQLEWQTPSLTPAFPTGYFSVPEVPSYQGQQLWVQRLPFLPWGPFNSNKWTYAQTASTYTPKFGTSVYSNVGAAVAQSNNFFYVGPTAQQPTSGSSYAGNVFPLLTTATTSVQYQFVGNTSIYGSSFGSAGGYSSLATNTAAGTRTLAYAGCGGGGASPAVVIINGGNLVAGGTVYNTGPQSPTSSTGYNLDAYTNNNYNIIVIDNIPIRASGGVPGANAGTANEIAAGWVKGGTDAPTNNNVGLVRDTTKSVWNVPFFPYQPCGPPYQMVVPVSKVTSSIPFSNVLVANATPIPSPAAGGLGGSSYVAGLTNGQSIIGYNETSNQSMTAVYPSFALDDMGMCVVEVTTISYTPLAYTATSNATRLHYMGALVPSYVYYYTPVATTATPIAPPLPVLRTPLAPYSAYPPANAIFRSDSSGTIYFSSSTQLWYAVEAGDRLFSVMFMIYQTSWGLIQDFRITPTGEFYVLYVEPNTRASTIRMFTVVPNLGLPYLTLANTYTLYTANPPWKSIEIDPISGAGYAATLAGGAYPYIFVFPNGFGPRGGQSMGGTGAGAYSILPQLSPCAVVPATKDLNLLGYAYLAGTPPLSVDVILTITPYGLTAADSTGIVTFAYTTPGVISGLGVRSWSHPGKNLNSVCLGPRGTLFVGDTAGNIILKKLKF